MENINENAENGNWIKISRKILDWEWYKDSATKDVFIDLLLEAQWKDCRYMGNEIKRGQLITSVEAIKNRTGLSTQNIRTALVHLEKTGEISKQTNKHFTLVTICKYDSYQCKDSEANEQPNNQPTNSQQTTNNIQERNNDKNDKNIPLKETIKENPAEVPSQLTSNCSGVGSDEPTNCANENLNLNSKMRNENSSLGSIKKLSSNLRIKNVSSDELILFCNYEILNKTLGKDEENRIKELYSQYASTNQESTLVSFALKLLNILNGEFALKFKKKYASKIKIGKKNPFTVNDVLQYFYGHYSEKSVEGCKKEIENYYAQLELQGFKSKSSGKDVSLPWFVDCVEKRIKTKLKTREQEAPFTKEDIKKALPYEDEKVMEKLESKYDKYCKRGNWTTNKGNDVDLEMFTGFFRKMVIEELKEEGYVPKENKKISRDGRKYFEVEDIPELLKKFSGRS